MPAEVRHTKGERTRERIRSAALRSFRENGYDATTIRGLADELGMSVGATNYHFASKNHLIQELYLDVQERHWAAAQPLLADATELIERLRIVFETGAVSCPRGRVPLGCGVAPVADQPPVR